MIKVSAVVLALLLAGCRGGPPPAPVVGEAYVGPVTLALRSDIPLQSSTATTVKHGDRVAILQQRRSFLKVRAPNGVEGWTDQRQLLAPDDMTALRELAHLAATMPSQGRAIIDYELRVHIQPAAKSPSFLILKANDKVDVLEHLTRTRTDLPRKPLVPPPPKKAKATGKRPPKTPQYPPPPMPKPPGPPANWLDLSKSGEPDDAPPADAAPEAPPLPTDDWSLVRVSGGESGWVLTRRLRMAIPDEVAQYAEGHRIVSYFSLGTVRDGDLVKDTWLWTTVGDGSRPYDFDSFRVFVWSSRRHRYETEYIERNLIGYSPVEVQAVSFSAGKGKAAATGEQYPGFSVCVDKKDGQRMRRQYAVMNTLVRLAGEQPCVLPPPPQFGTSPLTPLAATPAPQVPAEGMWSRWKKRVKGWFGQ